MQHNDRYSGIDDSGYIKHWKYIKKYRKNGKWQYIYKEPDAYDRGVTTTQNVTTKYHNSNTLFDQTEKTVHGPSNDTVISKGRGKISQAIDKGKDWIDKKMHGQSKFDKYDNNVTVKKTVSTKYQDTNDLFSSVVKKSYSSSPNKVEVIKKRGKIDRAIDRGKAYINAFVKDNLKKK